MSEILRTEHIVQRFGGMEALKDISMRVESGEIVGVIGPNGAGKTTLFNCITGMYCPTEGRVHMLGTDITGWGTRLCADVPEYPSVSENVGSGQRHGRHACKNKAPVPAESDPRPRR